MRDCIDQELRKGRKRGRKSKLIHEIILNLIGCIPEYAKDMTPEGKDSYSFIFLISSNLFSLVQTTFWTNYNLNIKYFLECKMLTVLDLQKERNKRNAKKSRKKKKDYIETLEKELANVK